MSAASDAYKAYQTSLAYERKLIGSEPRKGRRFLKTLWLLVRWPWRWLWMACHDWRLILIYVGWMAVVGCEVWVPLLLAFLSNDGAFRAWMLSVAGACEAFWLAPLTPFMPICVALTAGTKALMDRSSSKRRNKPYNGKEGKQ